jgi:predicted ribosome quality control (RQC) complex YloA/Tae2 family protein
MDRNKIYIGDHSIPTAILALLPLNSGTNPIKNREERALNAQRVEIQEQAQRAMNEEEFREAVKRIRERKEREHQAELARKKAAEQSKTASDRPIP